MYLPSIFKKAALESGNTSGETLRGGAQGAQRRALAMRLTNFTDYTLRVLVYLGAHREEDRLVTIGDIAAAYAISENHLMKVVHHLAKQGYVETVRGKGGGVRLARSPAEINVGAVVRDAEEDLALVECFHPGNANCPIVPVCTLRGVLSDAMGAFFQVLDDRTLADLLHPRTKLVGTVRDAGAPQ